ncbi:MAG: hypothetical protein LBI11_05945, partial [Streptococcaceae bacterium]|nr:hypothetical protein [Streptococcaceae bacterium]
ISVWNFSNAVIHDLAQLSTLPKIEQVLKKYSYSGIIHEDLTKSSDSNDLSKTINNAKWLKEQLSRGALLSQKSVGSTVSDHARYLNYEFQISSAYLENFPIYDENGKRVKISNSEKELVELVPLGMKAQGQAITSEVKEDHDFQETIASPSKSSNIHASNVKVIYIHPVAPAVSPNSAPASQVLYRVFTTSNISDYSGYGDEIIGSDNLYLYKMNKKGFAYDNDPNHLVNGLSFGEEAGPLYTNRVLAAILQDGPMIGVFSLSVVVYIFSFFIGFLQFKVINKKEIRTRVLLGVDKKIFYLKYLRRHLIFVIFLILTSVILANLPLLIMFACLLATDFVLLWVSGQNRRGLQND